MSKLRPASQLGPHTLRCVQIQTADLVLRGGGNSPGGVFGRIPT